MALAAFAALTRPDGVLTGIVIGLAVLVKEPRAFWRSLLIFALLNAPWYLFAWFYFGSPIPVTLAAKQHQAQMAISKSFAQGFLQMLRGYSREPFYWAHGVLAIVGIYYALVKRRVWLILLGWGLLYFVSYTLLGVSRYFWYYAPLVPALLTATGLGAALTLRLIPHSWITGLRKAIIYAVLFLLLLWPQVKGLWYLYRHPDPRMYIYREVGIWLANNTSTEESVGTLEVGIIGYYAQRRMIDFAGLIQPDVAKQMNRHTTYQDTAVWAIRRYKPDYLVLNPLWFPNAEDLLSSCLPQQSFSRSEYPGGLVVYRCAWTR